MNVLLISLDTTRADHLGCYGWNRNTSPHLDRLAERGTVFERCFSSGIPTHPAHTSMFTGQDVMRHQIVAQGGKAELSPEIATLAEMLQERGYFTAAADNLGRWFQRGFDLYQGYRWSHDWNGAWRKGEAVLDAALKVLDEASSQDRPFFIFVHFWDPHTPYLPPAPFDRMFYGRDETDPRWDSLGDALAFPPFTDYFRQWMGQARDAEFPRAQYDAEIAYMDCCLQHLLQRLETLGLAGNTLTIVTADHGEELGEHDIWFDHHGLYDTNLRVPLILHMPGTIPAGRRLPGMVRLMDIAPTVLQLAGAGPDRLAGMAGASFARMLSGGMRGGTCDTLYLTECTWMRKRGLRTGEWKLIVATEPDIHGKPAVELYRLKSDPGETRNVAEAESDTVGLLKRKLFAWVGRRLRETGLPDPIEEQEVTLRRVGPPQAAAARGGREAWPASRSHRA
jgi:arylsulfatase A-like enzyme